MNEKQKNVGLSFPNTLYGDTGMTLRDYFAAMAMSGDWAVQDESCGHFYNNSYIAILKARAELYYRMADAMLKAREKVVSNP